MMARFLIALLTSPAVPTQWFNPNTLILRPVGACGNLRLRVPAANSAGARAEAVRSWKQFDNFNGKSWVI